MLSADAFLKLLATGVVGAFGLLVLAGNPRRSVDRRLGLFLLLIAANQAAEAARLWTDGATGIAFHRAATIFAALDPIVLYAFAQAYLKEGPADGAMLAIGGVGGALALHAGWALDPADASVYQAAQVALLAFTAIVYTVVLARVLAHRARSTGRERIDLLGLALCVAAFPVWTTMATALLYLRIHYAPIFLLGLCAMFLAAFVVARVAVRAATLGASADREGVRVVRRTLRLGVSLVLLLHIDDALAVIMGSPTGGVMLTPLTTTLGRASAALRWLLFAALVSVVAIRGDSFAISLRSRRRAARVLIGLAGLAAGGVLLSFAPLLAGETAQMPTWLLLALVAIFALSQGFQRAVDRVAQAFYGLSMSADPADRVSVYRLAVVRAVGEGKDPRTDEGLAKLRQDLELEANLAEAISAIAESEGGPIDVGHTVARRYRILKLIGRGSSGRVFLAHDSLLDRRVVIKELAVEDEETAMSALREARAAGGIGDSNVVTVFDVIQRSRSFLLIEEHVEGGSLADRLARDGKLDAAAGIRLLDGILEGLSAVHAHGIVHRDLSPANVLLAADGTPRIADFGLARLGHAASRTQVDGAWGVSGTVAFMAPEQRDGRVATPRSDVYAVGLLARASIAEPTPPAVERVIQRALEVDPLERWEDARPMLAALRSAQLQ